MGAEPSAGGRGGGRLRANQKGPEAGLRAPREKRAGPGGAGGSAAPGEVGGEREAGVDPRPEVEIPRPREAGDAKAEGGLAARGQEPRRAAELRGRAGQGGAALALSLSEPRCALPGAHLQKDRGHPAGLGRRPVQVPPAAVPAQQLQSEGPRGGQQRGWKRGHQETSLRGSPGLQGHPAQLGAPRNPSQHDVGEVGQRPFPAAAGAQPCHLNQQLGPETCDRRAGRSGPVQDRATPGRTGGAFCAHLRKTCKL